MSKTAREVLTSHYNSLETDDLLEWLDREGLVIVPKEPTFEMASAAWDAAKLGPPMGRVIPPFCNEASRISEDCDTMRIGWRAMIAAAQESKP